MPDDLAYPDLRCQQLSRRGVLGAAVGGLAGGVSFGGVPLAAMSAEALSRQAALPFVEVAEGIHVRFGLQEEMDAGNSGAIANIGFIVGEDSVAVIDTGATRQQGAALLEAVRSVTDKPVSHLIATHVHLDHCFGHAAFSEMDVANIGHANLPRALAERGPFYRDRIRALSPEFADTDYLPPTTVVERRLSIDLGNRPLELVAWPAAHTDSDLTITDARTGTLWAADLLFVDRLPTLDGNLNGWISALERLVPPGIRSIVPGHGPVCHDREALQTERAYLVGLRDDVRRALDEGLDLTSAVARLEDRPPDGWLLAEAFHGRNIVTAYTQLEWE